MHSDFQNLHNESEACDFLYHIAIFCGPDQTNTALTCRILPFRTKQTNKYTERDDVKVNRKETLQLWSY